MFKYVTLHQQAVLSLLFTKEESPDTVAQHNG